MTVTATTTHQARSAADHYGPGVVRGGWIAKGVVFVLIGILTLQLALGDPSHAPDQQGALRAVADQPFGSVLLVLLAVGLAAYAVGRWLEASVLAEPDLDAFERVKLVATGVLYAALAVAAVRLLSSGGTGGGGRRPEAQSVTADVLDAPLGRWLVGAVGLGFVAAALYEAGQGVTNRFLDDLDTGAMSKGVRVTTERIGQAGLIARGVAWALIGWFLVRAAVQYDPSEAKGLDQALRSLADEGWGTAVLLVVAVGFAGYGGYCAVQARYRRIGGS
jgi:hypothetical protein